MTSVPDDLVQRLHQHGQEHLLSWWGELRDDERRELLDQIRALDLDLLQRLYHTRDERTAIPLDRIAPVTRPGAAAGGQHRTHAEDAWRQGKVAYLVVAGGQGSRLGFEHPKGMYPVGPVSGKSLFQFHAEKVVALQRRYSASFPFLVMTSPSTHAETVAYFAAQRNFGLEANEVHFFCQGTMPALDYDSGKILLESKARLFASPNGHGGSLTALADSGLLARLKAQGIETIYYYQVDNPVVNLADADFLGRHLAARSQVSSKVISREKPEDKLGVFVKLDGRLAMVEYSDLPSALSRQEEAPGRLRFWAGNPAIHLFDLAFLDEVTRNASMPWHLAHKKVAYLGPDGSLVTPARENALKFERFIFDALPLADRWLLIPVERADEFVPLKNASGADSPDTMRQGLCNHAGKWLEQAGTCVPRRPNGDVAVLLEISPLFALDAKDLAGKALPTKIECATYLE